MTELANARRTLDKAEQALQNAKRYFEHKEAANAATHLSEKVLQSPLHAQIVSVLEGIGNFHATYPADGETRDG